MHGAVTRSILPLFLLLGACATSDADPADVARRDSAGVEIVESTAPAWKEGEGWTVDSVPSLAVGVAEGAREHEFNHVSDVLPLSGGGFVVADGGNRELRWFDDEGRLVATAGREGKGPGEFVGLGSIWVRGDTVVALDDFLHRVSLFHPAGRFIRSIQVPQGPPLGGSVFFAALLDDGTVLVRAPATGNIAGASRRPERLHRIDASGRLLGGAGEVPGQPLFGVEQEGGFTGYRVPFAQETKIVPAPGGYLVGVADEGALRLHRPDGSLQRIVRVRTEPVRVTSKDLDVYLDQAFEGADAAYRARMNELYARMPVPRTYPAFRQMVVDDAGNVWAERYPRPGDAGPAAWSVIDPSGRWLGDVTLPAGFTLLHAARDALWGKTQTDDAVDRVTAFPLRK